MDLGGTVRVLLRRWLVVLIGLLLTLGAAASLHYSAPPRYQSEARMLLLLPADARGPGSDGSPYLYLPSGLNVISGLVVGAVNNRQFREDVADRGFIPNFEVGTDGSVPIITVTVAGPDAQLVIDTRDYVVSAIQEELEIMQREEDVPAYQMAHLRIYDADDIPNRLGGNATRAVLGTLAAGAVITLIAAFGLEGLSRLRRARAHEPLAEDTRSGPGATDAEATQSELSNGLT